MLHSLSKKCIPELDDHFETRVAGQAYKADVYVLLFTSSLIWPISLPLAVDGSMGRSGWTHAAGHSSPRGAANVGQSLERKAVRAVFHSWPVFPHTFQLEELRDATAPPREALAKPSFNTPICKINISPSLAASICAKVKSFEDLGLNMGCSTTSLHPRGQIGSDPDSWILLLDFFPHMWLNVASLPVTPTLTLDLSAPRSLNLEPNYKIRLLKGDPRFALLS